MATDKEAGEKLSSTERWFFGMVAAALITGIGSIFQMRITGTETNARLGGLSEDVQTLTGVLSDRSNEIRDLETRMRLMESKKILPTTEREIADIKKQYIELIRRLDALERKMP